MTTLSKKTNCKTHSSNFLNNESEVRLILLGRAGEGKSELGNLLLGRQEFETAGSAGSVTRESAHSSTFFNGRKLVVGDTPGLFDTEFSHEKVLKEITRTFYDFAPGPHGLLIVTAGRQTAEAEKTLTLLMHLFGSQITHYCIVVVTHEDDLIEDEITLQKYLGDTKSPLHTFVNKCGGRCIAVNSKTNVSGERNEKLNELLRYIDEIAHSNQTPYFTDAKFQQAATDEARRLQEEEEKTRKDLGEDEIRRQENDNLQQREKQAIGNRQTVKQNIEMSKQARNDEQQRQINNSVNGSGIGAVCAALCYVTFQVVCAIKNGDNRPLHYQRPTFRRPDTLNSEFHLQASFNFNFS